jgi:hypothetical protein
MMACPICDQKPMNCDCTETERRLFAEMAELEEQVASLRLTDEERSVIEVCATHWQTAPASGVLRRLLERTKVRS